VSTNFSFEIAMIGNSVTCYEINSHSVPPA
jgi:hypothetical protein